MHAHVFGLWEEVPTQSWGEHANSTKKESWLADSNPGESHCEAAVLTTAPAKSRSDCKMNLLLL